MAMEGFWILVSCKDETCCMSPELSQYLITWFGWGGRCRLVTWMYFSKNKNAEQSPLDCPECTLHCGLGDVLAHVHSFVVVVEIVQEKALL